MNMHQFNWHIWAGFGLSVAAFFTYPFVFAMFPVTRDFPWANLLFFGVAAVLVLVGVRRAFAPDRSRQSKIASAALATLSVVVFGFFVFFTFILSKQLPASHGAPQIGQKAPDFRLADRHGKPVSLTELLSSPLKGKAPKGVLLVFYRGSW